MERIRLQDEVTSLRFAVTHGRHGGIADAVQDQPRAYPLDGNIVIGNNPVDSLARVKRIGPTGELSRVEKPFSQTFEVSGALIARPAGIEAARHPAGILLSRHPATCALKQRRHSAVETPTTDMSSVEGVP